MVDRDDDREGEGTSPIETSEEDQGGEDQATDQTEADATEEADSTPAMPHMASVLLAPRCEWPMG